MRIRESGSSQGIEQALIDGHLPDGSCGAGKGEFCVRRKGLVSGEDVEVDLSAGFQNAADFGQNPRGFGGGMSLTKVPHPGRREPHVRYVIRYFLSWHNVFFA